MVRNAIADENLLPYFHHVAKQNTFSVGLILGQSLSGKDYIVHFAKTPPFQPHDAKDNTFLRLKSVSDVNEGWLADHARQASRMLPGGMNVLGFFLVSPEDILNPVSPKIKSLVSGVYKFLDSQKYLFGNCNNEKLVVNYVTKTQQIVCKSVEVGTGSVKPAEIKFLSSPIRWTQIHCKYVIDQIYNINENENHWPLKKHMGLILEMMSKNLKSSVFMFDGEIKDGDETIESVGKKKIARGNKTSGHEDVIKALQVCILQKCESVEPNCFQISENGNQIKIFGHIVSKLWLNPKMTVSGACEAVIQDIMRSLSTRLEMHWDSLTEEEHAEDVNSVHEPPRRVLISLPNCNIALSDYLFPGEGPNDAKISLEELLDIKIHNDEEIDDVEGQADLTEYYNEAGETESEEVIVKKPVETQKSLHYIGFGAALFILILSLVIHFMQKY